MEKTQQFPDLKQKYELRPMMHMLTVQYSSTTHHHKILYVQHKILVYPKLMMLCDYGLNNISHFSFMKLCDFSVLIFYLLIIQFTLELASLEIVCPYCLLEHALLKWHAVLVNLKPDLLHFLYKWWITW